MRSCTRHMPRNRTVRGVFLFILVLLGPRFAWADDLKPFTSKAGNFKILLAETPAEKKETVKAPAGDSVMNQFTASAGAAFIMLNYSDYPDKRVRAATAEQHVEIMAKDGPGAGKKVIETKKRMLGDHPGSEVLVTDGKVWLRFRYY